MRKIVATLLLAMIAITASAAMTRREKKDLIAKLPEKHRQFLMDVESRTTEAIEKLRKSTPKQAPQTSE